MPKDDYNSWRKKDEFHGKLVSFLIGGGLIAFFMGIALGSFGVMPLGGILAVLGLLSSGGTFIALLIGQVK